MTLPNVAAGGPQMSAPEPYVVEPYAPEPSGVVLGWYRIRQRGEKEIAIVDGEERARAWARLENKREYQRYLSEKEGAVRPADARGGE